MNGGTDSVSFKMKWKKWNQRGKMLLKHLTKSQGGADGSSLDS